MDRAPAGSGASLVFAFVVLAIHVVGEVVLELKSQGKLHRRPPGQRWFATIMIRSAKKDTIQIQSALSNCDSEKPIILR